MRFGVQLPTCLAGTVYPIPFARLDSVVRIAIEAEQLGFTEVSGNDHLSTGTRARRAWKEPPDNYEPLITLTAVAARTSVLRLVAGELALPLREPVLLAKQLATLDQFSDGRLTVAVGSCPDRGEFESVVPGLSDADAARSRLTRESIVCLRALFTERSATFSGNYRHFRDVECYPKPIQAPLPIYACGNADEVLEWAGELCQGWLATRIGPDEIRSGRKRVAEHARQAGRFERISTSLQSVVCLGSSSAQAHQRFQRSVVGRERRGAGNGAGLEPYLDGNLVGTPDQVCAKIQAFAEAGLDRLCAAFAGNSVDETLDQIRMFAEHVLPCFADRGDS
jgi:alkanesulfonate monooxygenase SsuD/methylene tetrahydromethanopterin reductase-like flavin-dependent oxidoreductase (luciferase family)